MANSVEKSEQLRDEEGRLPQPLPVAPMQGDQQRREKTIALLRLLWSQRIVLYRTLAAGLLAATVIAFVIPKKYTSTTRLMPPDEAPGGLAMLASLAGKSTGSSSLGALGGELLGLKTTGDLFAGVLASRTVEDGLISKFDLRKVYGDKRLEDTRKKLAERTSISVDRTSGIITIAVTDRSAQRAAGMAQEYVIELNRTVTDLNTSSAHKERIFLEGRLGQVQHDLESDEKQFSQFASKNTAIDIQEQGKAMIEAGASLEGQLIAAQTELQGLRQVFTDNNVRVRETQARIDEIRRQLQRLGGTGSVTKDSDSTAANADSNLLYPSIRQLPLLGVTYADLYRQMKVQEAVFEALTQEYELAKVEEAKETPSVRVLDPADIPEKKSSPKRLLIIFLGATLAGIFGVAWVMGNAKWQAVDQRDPGKILAQEVLHSFRIHLPWISRNGSSGISENSKNPKETIE